MGAGVTSRRWLIAIVVAFVALASVQFARCAAHFGVFEGNRAQQEAKLLERFLLSTGSIELCHHGDSGYGIANREPWHRTVLLTDEQPEAFTKQLLDHLRAHEYRVVSRFVVNDERLNRPVPLDQPYWAIEGTRDGFTVEVRTEPRGEMTGGCYRALSPTGEENVRNATAVAEVTFRGRENR